MEESKEKVVVNATGDQIKILHGTDFHELTIKTAAKFETSHPQSFIAFCALPQNKETSVYYTEKEVLLVENVPDHNTNPLAKLVLKNSIQLQQLLALNRRQMNYQSMEKSLLPLRSYFDQDAMRFYDHVRSPKIKKVLDVEQTQDNQGNFMYTFKFESDTKEDVKIPKSIALKLPVYTFIDINVNFSFEPVLSHDIVDKKAILEVSINNYEIDVVLQDVSHKVINEMLKDIQQPKYFGTMNVSKYDDQNRFHHPFRY